MYLSYETYKSFGGTLDETAYYNYEFEARTVVDWYTFGRIPKWFASEEDYPEVLPRCMFAIIKLLQQIDEANSLGQSTNGSTDVSGNNGAVQSQSNDGVSISYNVVSASEKIANADKEKAAIVQKYFNTVVDSLGRRILYRGLYPGE